jgi:hypothetical protein
VRGRVGKDLQTPREMTLPLGTRAREAVGDDVLDHVPELVDLDGVAYAEVVDPDDVDGDVVMQNSRYHLGTVQTCSAP